METFIMRINSSLHCLQKESGNIKDVESIWLCFFPFNLYFKLLPLFYLRKYYSTGITLL